MDDCLYSVTRKYYTGFLFLVLFGFSAHGQVVIDDLSYEITMYGDVVLRWTSPQGTIVSKYSIYRGTSFGNMKLIAELYSPTTRQYTDHNSNIVPGSRYIYGLEAMDTQGFIGWKPIDVLVTPPPSNLRFLSSPPTTAHIGSDYWYFPQVNASRPEDIEYSFGGKRPDGMELNSISGGIITSLYWVPLKAGQYNVTIVATHKQTRAIAVQEYTIRVSTQPGVVRGMVKSVLEKPIPNTVVRIFQVADAIMYETITDSLGSFALRNVQAGELYAYAKPPSDKHVPQWYSMGLTLKDVSPRSLLPNDTLIYEFYLLTGPDRPVSVAGFVRDNLGQPVQNTSISFVQKNRFIHIGDTAVITNPGFLEKFLVDTTVFTDAGGRYEAFLDVGKVYYSLVQKPGYLAGFNADHPTAAAENAMEARPFRVRDGMSVMNFTLKPHTIKTENRIVGTISNAENGINKQAVVILIDPELKRGASGGHTYRSYRSTLSDENGYYQFENLSYATYSVLAIPLEKGLAPMYYKYGGGTTVSELSDGISPNGTVQDINLALHPTRSTGVGTIYGQVVVQDRALTYPAIGTLVFAEVSTTRQIIGYAITDSTGWYSIAGLPPGEYLVHADHPSYGSKISSPIPLDFKTYNVFNSLKLANFIFTINVTSIHPEAAPVELTLYQNYPNPFNPSTSIRFYLPRQEFITLRVLNALGQEVQLLTQGRIEAGTHTVQFEASELPSGMYYYQLQTADGILSKKMVLMK